MNIVITGANSAVGQAILRCGPKHEVTANTFVAAVRSARAAEQIRSVSGNANGVVRISYDDAGSLDAAFQGALAVIHLAGVLVETPDSIMILTEMVHDARIVRMNAQHLPKNIRRWMGDSVGHWDGDTLVIDTTNFTNKTRFRGSTENLHVVERLKRIDDRTLLYRFTVEDSDTWDRPWTGEMTWPLTTQPIYEYACHEGNYALGDVLRGARHQEAEEAAAKAKK